MEHSKNYLNFLNALHTKEEENQRIPLTLLQMTSEEEFLHGVIDTLYEHTTPNAWSKAARIELVCRKFGLNGYAETSFENLAIHYETCVSGITKRLTHVLRDISSGWFYSFRYVCEYETRLYRIHGFSIEYYDYDSSSSPQLDLTDELKFKSYKSLRQKVTMSSCAKVRRLNDQELFNFQVEQAKSFLEQNGCVVVRGVVI